jgi:phosphatidylserine/phosphatidylglycerophosphate/cardiolipin synthase-like enzyme
MPAIQRSTPVEGSVGRRGASTTTSKVMFDDRPRIAHNKTIIIDPDGANPAVETGSFNFSYSAEHRNAENALFVRDDPALAAVYERYFQVRLTASDPW